MSRVPFQGEVMKCEQCGRCYKSSPYVESNWTLMMLEFESGTHREIYVCPACFGNDWRFWSKHVPCECPESNDG